MLILFYAFQTTYCRLSCLDHGFRGQTQPSSVEIPHHRAGFWRHHHQRSEWNGQLVGQQYQWTIMDYFFNIYFMLEKGMSKLV